jgi:hypothetical protein
VVVTEENNKVPFFFHRQNREPKVSGKGGQGGEAPLNSEPKASGSWPNHRTKEGCEEKAGIVS